MNLDMQLLRSFAMVVEEGAFAGAADRLHVTPSAISGHIKRLEQFVGKQLIRRTTRRLHLTDDGELLHEYARTLVGLEQEVLNRLRKGPEIPRLRIGATEDFAGSWLPRVLREFKRANPVGKLELRVGLTSELVRQLDRGRLDLVFGKHCADEERAGELLWEESLIWAYASTDGSPLPSVVPLAVFPDNCVYRRAATESLSGAGLPWVVVVETASMAGCLAAAEAGLAVTVIAQSQLRPGLAVMDSKEGLPPLPLVRFYVYVRKPGAATDSLVRAVRAAGSRHRFAGTRSL